MAKSLNFDTDSDKVQCATSKGSERMEGGDVCCSLVIIL